MKLALTNFSIRHPWLVVRVVGLATVFLAAQFPKVHFDNDPENMLAPDEHVRILHHQVKEKYGLYDFVIVGVVNEKHPDGIFNPETLGRIHDLTGELLSLRVYDRYLLTSEVIANHGADSFSTRHRPLDLVSGQRF